MCGGEGVCDDGTGMGSCMIVSPHSTTERGWSMVRWMVKDVNYTFFMLATKFGNEKEVPSTIKKPSYLMNELV